MPIPRKVLINSDTTHYYHCLSRCVRQAYLCGEDHATGKNYEHRRTMLLDRLKHLAKHFAVDVCAYAIMHNHYHLVLRINAQKAKNMSKDQVIKHWTSIYTGGNELVKQYQMRHDPEKKIKKSVIYQAKKVIKEWRSRLDDISWFMRALNEFVAKRANKEDDKKGHFWESRFKSQALLDETAILSCMAYVDLNPVRANITDNLDTSDFTSIQKRIQKYAKTKDIIEKAEACGKKPPKKLKLQPKRLLPFDDGENNVCMEFSLQNYFALVDWTSRIIKPNKHGFVKPGEPPLLESIGIDESEWLDLTQNFERKFAGFAGKKSVLYSHANEKLGQRQCKGVG